MKILPIFLLSMISFVTIGQTSKCQGDCENGYGIYIDKKGNRYEGNWKEGKKNGIFKYFYADGDRFEGSVKNDLIGGYGTYESSEFLQKGELLQIMLPGNVYTIVLNGKGEFLNKKDLSIQKGYFKKDTLDGEGEHIMGGQVERGNYVKGKIEGKGYLKYENGDVFEGNFSAGLKNGKGKVIYSTGATLEGNWVNNRCIDCPNENINPNAIKLIKSPNQLGYDVMVTFDDQLTIKMKLDTGADILLLKKEHFLSLLAEGKIRKNNRKNVSLRDASGNLNDAFIYEIQKLKVGNYELRNIECAINFNSTDSPNLFGMSAIKKLGPEVSIDFKNNTLNVKQ